MAPTYTQSGTFDAIQPEAAPCCAAGTRHEEPHAHEGAWWFVITDIVAALTDATDPSDYWKKMRRRDPDLSLDSQGGTNPSPKAEPVKRWLAMVGKEPLDEIENPELAMGRMQELYEKKGYPKEWIDKRLRGIAARQDLSATSGSSAG